MGPKIISSTFQQVINVIILLEISMVWKPLKHFFYQNMYQNALIALYFNKEHTLKPMQITCL